MLDSQWIGITRAHIEDCVCTGESDTCDRCRDAFIWVDDTEMVLDGWSNFNEPGNSECVCLEDDGWHDEDCATMLQFICERG